MSLLSRLDAWTIRATRVVALFGLAALLVIAFATLADVGARWIFLSPILGVYDISTLFISVAMAACFPAAMAERRNIRVEFVADMVPLRVRLGFDVIAHLLLLGFLGLLAWQLWIYTGELIGDGETSYTLGVPVGPWWIATTGFFLVCVPVQVLVTCVALRDLIAGTDSTQVAEAL